VQALEHWRDALGVLSVTIAIAARAQASAGTRVGASAADLLRLYIEEGVGRKGKVDG
jgi:hypothetical protein